MKTKYKKILPAIILIVALIVTSGFLTGFQKPGEVKQGNISAYADLLEEENEDAENEESCTFLCINCGYTYTGSDFADLPEEWVCPACGGPKSGFESDDELKYSDPQAWLAHLEHVLAMRSKHLVVLQRVIDAHTLKNSPAIYMLYGALASSSKSVLKAQEAVDAYKEYMASLTDESSSNEENNNITSTTNEEIKDNGNSNKDKEKDNNKNNENKKNNQDKNQGNSGGKKK